MFVNLIDLWHGYFSFFNGGPVRNIHPLHLSLGIVATTDFSYARMRILKYGYHHSIERGEINSIERVYL